MASRGAAGVNQDWAAASKALAVSQIAERARIDPDVLYPEWLQHVRQRLAVKEDPLL
jgi:hypothetical protein